MSDARPGDEQPVARYLEVNGLRYCVFEWAGDGPPIVLAHATGFHGRVWDAVARRLPGRRLIALDFRGHGRSAKPEPPYPWTAFGDDLAALTHAMGLEGAVGVGHSMGGHSMVYAAARVPQAFAALVLVDATISTGRPWPRPDVDSSASGSPASFVAKRRNEWESPEQMIERFAPRPPYASWRRDVLDDYVRYGLLPAPTGEGYVLACPPAIEASIYERGGDTSVLDEVARIEVPVRVLRAKQPEPGVTAIPFTTSPTSPDLASRFPRGEDVLLGHLSHFIPMEEPDTVAAHILEVARGLEG